VIDAAQRSGPAGGVKGPPKAGANPHERAALTLDSASVRPALLPCEIDVIASIAVLIAEQARGDVVAVHVHPDRPAAAVADPRLDRA
jgi:hypothetical protein